MLWNDIKRIDDEAENVAKFVYTNSDAVAESVLYRYPTYEERTVICCSTQSGCPVGCRFCGAGDYFARNLTAEEIVEQVDYSIEQTGVYPHDMKKLQIMFMSMGEPMLNLKNLIPAIEALHEKYPHAALLVSTSAPDIGDVNWTEFHHLAIRVPTVGLQFSIHESTEEARNKLIPFKKKLSFRDIMIEGIIFNIVTGRKPFFNYCAHDNNSSDEDADRIFDQFPPRNFNATVSVVCERNEGMPASNEHQRNLAVDFSSKLLARGYDVRVFDPAGQDTIGGGCGQLWFVQDWMRNNPDKVRPSIGNGRETVHAPKA